MTCAETIKKLRKQLYLQQAEFADALGISKSTVCGYEQGNRIPKLPIARRIKEFAKKNNIELNMDDLIGGN